MKKMILLLATAAAILSGCSSQKSQGSGEWNAGLREAIESREFTVDVKRAIPSSGRSVDLSTPYSLTVDGDNVESHLPYFGRAYSLPYGGGEGLIFDGKMEGYSLSYGKRGEARINFLVRTREDTYRFGITIFSNGSATIDVSPNNKQSIDFNGDAAPNPTGNR